MEKNCISREQARQFIEEEMRRPQSNKVCMPTRVLCIGRSQMEMKVLFGMLAVK
jgi:hypothetical protein